MLALQDRLPLRYAPNVAALRSRLNKVTEKYFNIENFLNVKNRPG